MAETQAGTKKTEYLAVKMSDGREVNFPLKRRMLKERLVEKDTNGNATRIGVRFDWVNGNTLTVFVPEHQVAEAAAHGYMQKLGDEGTSVKKEDGTSGDPEDVQLAIEDLHERLSEAGSEWNMVRTGEGFGGASVLMKALIEWSGMSAEQVKEFLKGKSQQEKIALREKSDRPGKTGATIKEIVTRLEADKKKSVANIDTDSLLGGLGTA